MTIRLPVFSMVDHLVYWVSAKSRINPRAQRASFSMLRSICRTFERDELELVLSCTGLHDELFH